MQRYFGKVTKRGIAMPGLSSSAARASSRILVLVNFMGVRREQWSSSDLSAMGGVEDGAGFGAGLHISMAFYSATLNPTPGRLLLVAKMLRNWVHRPAGSAVMG